MESHGGILVSLFLKGSDYCPGCIPAWQQLTQSRMWALICHCAHCISQCPPHQDWASAATYYEVPEVYRAINISGKIFFLCSYLYWNEGGDSIAGENFMLQKNRAVSLQRGRYLYITSKQSVSPASFRAVSGSLYPVTQSPDSFNMDALISFTPLLTIIQGSLWLSEENLTFSTWC